VLIRFDNEVAVAFEAVGQGTGHRPELTASWQRDRHRGLGRRASLARRAGLEHLDHERSRQRVSSRLAVDVRGIDVEGAVAQQHRAGRRLTVAPVDLELRRQGSAQVGITAPGGGDRGHRPRGSDVQAGKYQAALRTLRLRALAAGQLNALTLALTLALALTLTLALTLAAAQHVGGQHLAVFQTLHDQSHAVAAWVGACSAPGPRRSRRQRAPA